MKTTVLLVDDHDQILEFIQNDLADEYTVLIARNGQEALDIMDKESVQLVISDVMMPVMDGFELCKRIKSDFKNSHVAVILLTAKNTLQSKIEGLELGADAYIDKPFSPKHLRVQIANLLTNKNKIKTYFAQSPMAMMKSLAYSKADEKFLDDLQSVISTHMSEIDLDVEHLAQHMNMSRPTLYRKIKDISDLTPNELVNIARLKKAADLLAEGSHRINEIAEMVGYASSLHFNRNFQKQFGMSPSEYLKQR
ncbi:response regulator transcription factor [Pseudochryseolinea flava]|uniref:Two-component system response regulator n=1 Tax=Pseudochryseolinea flava TaxID=2059302 RepID=A0A364XXB9_9BACT|nr:response regulator [Pseudochryseolinea flava]RAV98931.1 two-component system response regulator [Pseudochryseolinea flava]